MFSSVAFEVLSGFALIRRPHSKAVIIMFIWHKGDPLPAIERAQLLMPVPSSGVESAPPTSVQWWAQNRIGCLFSFVCCVLSQHLCWYIMFCLKTLVGWSKKAPNFMYGHNTFWIELRISWCLVFCLSFRLGHFVWQHVSCLHSETKMVFCLNTHVGWRRKNTNETFGPRG